MLNIRKRWFANYERSANTSNDGKLCVDPNDNIFLSNIWYRPFTLAHREHILLDDTTLPPLARRNVQTGTSSLDKGVRKDLPGAGSAMNA